MQCQVKRTRRRPSQPRPPACGRACSCHLPLALRPSEPSESPARLQHPLAANPPQGQPLGCPLRTGSHPGGREGCGRSVQHSSILSLNPPDRPAGQPRGADPPLPSGHPHRVLVCFLAPLRGRPGQCQEGRGPSWGGRASSEPGRGWGSGWTSTLEAVCFWGPRSFCVPQGTAKDFVLGANFGKPV